MTEYMGRVVCDITITADGYSAGLNQTEQRPFGDDGGCTSCRSRWAPARGCLRASRY